MPPHMGERLARRLRQLGWTQVRLAKRLGCSRQLIWQWLHQASWNLRTVQRVAAAVRVRPSYFLREEVSGPDGS